MKILLNILTHGDEKIGLDVAQRIQTLPIEASTLQVQIANQRAYERGTRFIEQDLNRAFPGKRDGTYEERLAYRLSPAIKAADIVIDIHSTTSQLKDAVIVTKLDRTTTKYLDAIQPKYVLVMEATKEQALISQAKVGLAFEYGNDADPVALRKIVADIKRLLSYCKILNQPLRSRNVKTRYFSVKSAVAKLEGYCLAPSIKNYQLIRQGEAIATKGEVILRADEDFYPILFGQDNYQDQFGFKGKEIYDLIAL